MFFNIKFRDFNFFLYICGYLNRAKRLNFIERY
jgi:hypothetical protein